MGVLEPSLVPSGEVTEESIGQGKMLCAKLPGRCSRANERLEA
jgi:hypothetical protein